MFFSSLNHAYNGLMKLKGNSPLHCPAGLIVVPSSAGIDTDQML